MPKNIVDKNSFYTGKELHNLKIANLEKIKVADRQGLLVPIVIDRPSHQSKALEGNIYALDYKSMTPSEFDKLEASMYSKKLYYGENINFWLGERIDPDLTIKGSKKGTALRRLSDDEISSNYKRWSKKYNSVLTKKLGKDFLKKSLIDNNKKKFSNLDLGDSPSTRIKYRVNKRSSFL